MEKSTSGKCPMCGNDIQEGHRICLKCGYRFSKTKKHQKTQKKIIIISAVIVIIAVLLIAIMMFNTKEDTLPQTSEQPEVVQIEKPRNTLTPLINGETPSDAQSSSQSASQSNRGKAEPIPENIKAVMNGKSMTDNKNIGYNDLSYLTIPYLDYSYTRQIGHMVVAADLAEEVLSIFSELYDAKYPIESMELVDYFFDKQTEVLDSPDRASMGNNNTSAFYYRVVSGTKNLSKHAYGRAIDINPKVNPYVVGSSVSPANAKKYMDRTCAGWTDIEKASLIAPNTAIYKIFTKYSWEWGGEIWSSCKDYQHFQKKQ